MQPYNQDFMYGDTGRDIKFIQACCDTSQAHITEDFGRHFAGILCRDASYMRRRALYASYKTF